MERSERLRLVSRLTYYLAWIAALLATALHQVQGLDDAVRGAVHISARNLLEATAILFIACMASEVRAAGVSGGTKASSAAAGR